MELETHIDLCAGIGGFSLAARHAGCRTIAWVEKDPFCQWAMQKNFPDATPHADLYDFDGRAYRGQCDLLTAGFPCQPFSVAGKRRGASDDRHLWPEIVRVLRQVRPRWCLFENVTGLLSLAEPDSASSVEREEAELFYTEHGPKTAYVERIERRIIARIFHDIEQAGYLPLRAADGTPILLVIPACSVGAIHRRDRIWIAAHAQSPICQKSGFSRQRRAGHSDNSGCHGRASPHAHRERQQQPSGPQPEIWRRLEHRHSADASHALCQRRENWRHGAQTKGAKQNDELGNHTGRPVGTLEWQPNDTSEIIRVAYGLPGRVARRTAKIKAYGNAIVWQVAWQIIHAIQSTAHHPVG